MPMLHAIDVDQVAGARDEHWSQEAIAEANGSLFKAAKGIGSTTWHAHDDQDTTEGTATVPGRVTVCDNGERVGVQTFDAAGNPADLPFHLAVSC